MIAHRRPRRPHYLTLTYLMPAVVIFLDLFQTIITDTAIIIAAVLAFPVYKLFALIGNRFDFSHSYLLELLYLREIDLNQSLDYKVARYLPFFRRIRLLRIFEFIMISNILVSDDGKGILQNAKAFCGFLIIAYIITDFLFVGYDIIVGKRRNFSLIKTRISRPLRPDYLTSIYLMPASGILVGLCQANVFRTVIIPALSVSFLVYSGFFLLGKRYGFCYSNLLELLYLRKLDLNKPQGYWEEQYFSHFRRIIPLRMFELALILIIVICGDLEGIFLDITAFCGLLILFYNLIDCMFVCYVVVFRKHLI